MLLTLRCGWRTGILNGRRCKDRLRSEGKDKNSGKQQTTLHASGHLGLEWACGDQKPWGRVTNRTSYISVEFRDDDEIHEQKNLPAYPETK